MFTEKEERILIDAARSLNQLSPIYFYLLINELTIKEKEEFLDKLIND